MSDFLCNAYLVTTAFSVAATHLRYNSAKNTLLREGYETTPSNRSFSERISDFLKDNWFLAVPIYNVIRTVKLIKQNRFDYARGERKEELLNRGVIKKEEKKEKPAKKEEKVKVVEKVVEPEYSQVPQMTMKNTYDDLGFEDPLFFEQPIKKEKQEVINLSIDDEIALYKSKYNSLVAKYNAMPANTSKEVMDTMYDEMVNLRESYFKAVDKKKRIDTLDKLKTQRANILSTYSLDDEVKMTLK